MFRIAHLKWQRYWSQRSFDKKAEKLKKRNASQHEFAELDHDEYTTLADIENGIDYVVSRKLLDKARSLDVDIPPMSDETSWSRSDDGEFGWLTSKGRAAVRKAIDDEKSRRFEVRTLWV